MHDELFAAHAMPAQLAVFGDVGTYTITRTAEQRSISGRLTELVGDEQHRVAELAIYADETRGVTDPRPGDTWVEDGATWEVTEESTSTGGRHLLLMRAPKVVGRPTP